MPLWHSETVLSFVKMTRIDSCGSAQGTKNGKIFITHEHFIESSLEDCVKQV